MSDIMAHCRYDDRQDILRSKYLSGPSGTEAMYGRIDFFWSFPGRSRWSQVPQESPWWRNADIGKEGVCCLENIYCVYVIVIWIGSVIDSSDSKKKTIHLFWILSAVKPPSARLAERTTIKPQLLDALDVKNPLKDQAGDTIKITVIQAMWLEIPSRDGVDQAVAMLSAEWCRQSTRIS